MTAISIPHSVIEQAEQAERFVGVRERLDVDTGIRPMPAR